VASYNNFHELRLRALPDDYAVVHLPLSSSPLPSCPAGAPLWSLTVSAVEYSLVLREADTAALQSPGIQVSGSWAAFYLEGPIPFNLTGIIARLTVPLADAKVGCFVVSTFDSDFILIKKDDCGTALNAWQQVGITTV